MIYFYGRKKKILRWYPSPIKDCIIEPFAGSAAYSCFYGIDRDVTLVEKSPRLAELWEWLIKKATSEDIMNIPSVKVGEITDNFLIILHSASKRAFDYKKITVTKIISENWKCNQPKMASMVGKIKHWKIQCGDYSEIKNTDATWFIDPPYKGESGMGYEYTSSMINYPMLAEWIRSRKGQIIACEGSNGDYLPFENLMQQNAINGKINQEKIFLNYN